MARTPLAKFIDDRLHERGETAEEFAERIGINSSGLYKFLRGTYGPPRQGNLEKIAKGLGMSSAAELLRAADAETEPDPIEQAIRQRIGDMREAVRDTPRSMWGTIIAKTFDRAIESARDMAELLVASDPETPVTSPRQTPVTEQDGRGNRGALPKKTRLTQPSHTWMPSLAVAG